MLRNISLTECLICTAVSIPFIVGLLLGLRLRRRKASDPKK
jgi:hypothetical protein